MHLTMLMCKKKVIVNNQGFHVYIDSSSLQKDFRHFLYKLHFYASRHSALELPLFNYTH